MFKLRVCFLFSRWHIVYDRTHYVEYLVSTVSKANIDPLPILDLTDCVQELRRRGIALPERGPWDTDEIYRGMCQKVNSQQINYYLSLTNSTYNILNCI